MRFTELLRGSTLQGDPSALTAAACVKLGRSLGTLTRRHTGSRAARIVVARGDEQNTVAVRDGVVRGLLLSGQDVKDIGNAAGDVFAFALKHLDAAAGVAIADGDALTLMFFVAGRPLVGDGLQALAELADGSDFAAGEGSLELVDLRTARRARTLTAAERA